MASKKPIINLRYRSVTQLNLIKRAAKLRHWSLNTFVVNAAETAAVLTIQEAVVPEHKESAPDEAPPKELQAMSTPI